MQKGFAWLVILIVGLLLIGGGVAGYIILSKPKFPIYDSPLPVITSDQPSPEPQASSDSETANWKTYINKDFKFSLRYPSGLKITEGRSYGVDNVYVRDSNEVSLITSSEQIVISFEPTNKDDIADFLSDYKAFDGKIGFDYEGKIVETLYIDNIKTLKGAVAGPKSNVVFTLIYDNKVYRIAFEPGISKTGELILGSLKFSR